MPTRPCWVEIRTRSLEDNYRFLQTLAAPHTELLAVVKADAYGQSLALCAPALVRAGAQWLGVTSVEEGIAVRALCPNTRILVMGGIFPGQGAEVIRHSLSASAWEPWQLDELEQAAKAAAAPPASVPIHLEIDTGMSRQGVNIDDLAAILPRFHAQSALRLDGVMTHLFAADEADGQATDQQFAQLDRALERVKAAALRPEWLNVGQSAALLAGRTGQIANLASRFAMKPLLRPGLALYGLAPQFDPPFDEPPQAVIAARHRLQPVLSWKTSVTSVRSIQTGAVVGYNGTFVATEPMRLALLPAGYADGLDRHLGDRFSLLVRGQRAPLIGRISMDQSVIDVTEIPGVQPGDEVVILGTQGEETITAFDHAEATGTIPWEVFTRIAARVRRVPV
ncbi:MAG: alanine racemase [Terracidiphilus sp.]|jgi:alanine racemase